MIDLSKNVHLQTSSLGISLEFDATVFEFEPFRNNVFFTFFQFGKAHQKTKAKIAAFG